MKTSEIESYYQVSKCSIKDVFCLHSLTESGNRLNGNKFLCAVFKQGTKFSLYNENIFYNKIEDLNKAIEDYLTNLKFNSENFYPSYRKGVSTEFCIFDYMKSMDFNRNDETFTYQKKDAFGSENVKIQIVIDGLGDYDTNIVNIRYNQNDTNWISIKDIEKTTENIIQNINNLIYPIFISNITNMITTFEKIENVNMDSDFKKINVNMRSLDVNVSDYKETLKNNLQELLKKLE